MIVSVSRRCDIPAFGLDSFLASLRAGSIEVPNPYDARRIRRVSLDPVSVEGLVFWTRDPRPLLARLDELGPFRDRFFLELTATGYPRALEPRVADAGAVVAAAAGLAARIGRERIAWRYDPLLLAGSLDPDWHARNFAGLAEALAGSVSRVVLSLVDEYARTRARVEAAGFPAPRFALPRAGKGATAPEGSAPGALPPEPWRGLLAELARLAAAFGLPAVACAEPWDLAPLGVAKAACVDAAVLAPLFGREVAGGKDKGQRPDCACAPSVDVGSYGSCPAGCVYCYARH